MIYSNGRFVEKAKLVKFAVENLNRAKSDRENIINKIVEKIKENNGADFVGEVDLIDEVKVKITKHDENTHGIEFIDISKDELALFKQLHLQVYKENEEYKFGVKFDANEQEFVLGGTNEKLPYRSQVSALEGGFAKHLALIAASTGSGKTITKLMFALVARLSGMEVVSVDARQDLVDQEYKDQKGAVSFSELGSINYNGTYNRKKKHNILSLENFFNCSNQVIDLEDLSNLVTKNNAEQQEFKVDLKNKRITIGKDIQIYRDHYEIKNGKYEKSVFKEKDVLLIFDEIQDMVNKGEAYHVQVQLLLLLASWKKINLVITTATPPVWIKEFIEKENGYIETQSLQEKIASGIGGKIDIEVCKNTRTKEFVQHYVDYGSGKILTRLEDEDYYYNPQKDSSTADIKEKIKKYITWNLQSQCNRMTLACIDSNDFKDSFKDKIIYPEGQLKTLRNKEEIKKQDKYYNKCDFYHQIGSYKSHGEVRELLIEQFGCTDDIDEVLSKFDYKSSIAESGVFAVEHGFINNVISCITEIPLDELDKERFLGSLDGKFKDFTNNCTDNQIDAEIDKRISDYISKLDIKDQDIVADIQKGMKIVWDLFEKYGNEQDNKKLSTLLNNHNLSKEIHSMMPPDLSKLSNDNIIEIFSQNKSRGIFQYLKNNYEKNDNFKDIEENCQKLYEKLEEGIKKAKKYKHDKLDPAKKQYDNCRQESWQELQDKYYKCLQEYESFTKESKSALIEEFKTVQEKFQDEEKYPLNELRKICNKLSVIDENNVERCTGDDLSRVGLVGFYFNDHRKSGFNNTILYNVLMKEATVDSLENKKQCVGRPGRKNGPIISSSYVDSSKISNLSKIKNKLMHGSPFDSFKKTEHKVDIKEHTEMVIRKIEEIIDSQFTADTTLNEDRYNKVVEDVIQYVLNVHREMYNHSEYNKDKTYKNFTKVLKSATSILEKELKNKEIVTGDCEIKLKTKDLEFKVANLLEKDENLMHSIKCIKEKKDRINGKLKIEVNFLKALIIKLCVLVLRLWHLKLSPKESQVQEILKKDGTPTLKERLILKRARVKVIDEVKALSKEQDEKKAKIENLKSEKTNLQNQYYSMPKYIGVIKRKENVTQKDITNEDKNKIIKEQLNKIKSELSKVQTSLSKQYEHKKDLAVFKELKNNIDIINLKVKVEPLINGQRQRTEEYKKNMQKISKSLMDLQKRIKGSDDLQDLIESIQKVENVVDGYCKVKDIKGNLVSENYKKNMEDIIKSLLDYINNKDKNRNCLPDFPESVRQNAKDKLEELRDSIIKLNDPLVLMTKIEEVKKILDDLSLYWESDQYRHAKKQIRNLKNLVLQEHKNHIQQVVERLLNNTRKIQAQRLVKDYKQQGRFKFERLYNIVNNQIGDLKGKELSNNDINILDDIGVLIEYYDEFTKEKTRLEEIEKKQEALVKEKEELEDEKQMLQNNDRQFDICRKLTVYESIDKNYELNRIIWSEKVLFELINKIQSKGNVIENRDLAVECVSSSVFLELFTNIVMPLFNDGNLKIALDIIESSGNSSKENVEKINEFYQNLLDRKFEDVTSDVNSILESMGKLCILILFVKLNHHSNSLKKDLKLVKRMTFGLFDPVDFLRNNLSNNTNPDMIQNLIRAFLQDNENADDMYKFLKECNPMTVGIRDNRLNSGTTLFSSLHLAISAFTIYQGFHTSNGRISKFFSNTSVKRGTEAIKKLGEGKDKNDVKRAICERLKTLEEGLDGSKFFAYELDELTQEEQHICRTQELSQKFKQVSKDPFPASLILNPSSQCLDNYHRLV